MSYSIKPSKQLHPPSTWDSLLHPTSNGTNTFKTSHQKQTLGFLRRNLQISSSQIKSTAYKALVRPQLEYCPTIWDPHTRKNINKIEMVQRRAARYATNRYRNRSSVGAMLQDLSWPTLEDRRHQSRLIMMYKISHGSVRVCTESLNPPSRRLPSHHSSTYQQPSTRTDAEKFAFYPRTIREWNCLPAETVIAKTADEFRLLLPPITP